MSQSLQIGVLLVLVGGALLRIAAGDEYLRYVKESMKPWLLLSGGLLVVLGILALVDVLRSAVRLPVTVKLRIGVVEQERGAARIERLQRFEADDEGRLHEFARAIVAAGCDGLIVHARQAVLGGLSPHENRTVPPLRFDVVERLRAAFPSVPFAVNGGIRDVNAVVQALGWCDSVMIGREAYNRPWLLAELQQQLYPQDDWRRPSADEVLEHMIGYAAPLLASGHRLSAITRHMLGLLTHTPGAREFRRLLAEGSRAAGADISVLQSARALLRPAA